MSKKDFINLMLGSPQDFSSKKVNQLIIGIGDSSGINGSGESTLILSAPNPGNGGSPETLTEPPPTFTAVAPVEKVTHKDLVEIVRRVFDLNEGVTLGKANKGPMGWLNRMSKRRRRKKFFKKIRKFPKSMKIYAEGDSWFEHPLTRDIIDWLSILSKKQDKRKPKESRKTQKGYAIYSSAYGGDWLSNIVKEGDYITEVSLIKPDVILLSGGGNDVVGGRKMAMMVASSGYKKTGLNRELKKLFKENFKNEAKTYEEKILNIDFDSKKEKIIDFFKSEEDTFLSKFLLSDDLDALDRDQFNQLVIGLSFLSKDYFALLWVFELLYKYVIYQITHEKHKKVKIITQGYDYPVPTSKKGPLFSWKKPFFQPRKYLLNKIMKNGEWLKDAISLRGVGEKKLQKSIMFAVIHLFNDTLIRVGKDELFQNRQNENGEKDPVKIYHIDSRGLAKEKDWFDEMHLRPRILKKVAQKYIEGIESEDSKKKVFKVRKD